jgi:hypothetical protein
VGAHGIPPSARLSSRISPDTLTLVNEQADRVIADLYSEYCKTAGIVAQGAGR